MLKLGFGNGSFPLIFRTLVVGKRGGGAGTVESVPGGIDCGERCVAVFFHGRGLELFATPMPGSVFSGWGGACTGRDSCFLPMTSDQSVTAAFEQLAP